MKEGLNLPQKKKKVAGVGINDADYQVVVCRRDGNKIINIWTCPYYSRWKGLMDRCFNIKYKERCPCYAEVTCCEEWKLFSNFKRWMETQDWEGKVLDKDLLYPHNKIYSPENCIFITEDVNNFLLKTDAIRGKYPLGVSRPKLGLKFEARCRIGGDIRLRKGFFTVEEAHSFWQEVKIGYGLSIIEESQSLVVKSAMENRVNILLNDYIAGRETKYF